MKLIKGKNRDEIEFFSLDGVIDLDNEVRLIDLFVDSLGLSDFGFKTDFVDNSRPAYHPSDLLKLYLYGYLNRVRSSRQLEKESKHYIMTKKSIKHAQADVGFIFTAFNLRRIFNIIDQNKFKKYLQVLEFYFFVLRSNFKLFGVTFIFQNQKTN